MARIALDAMGGDHAPGEIVAGAMPGREHELERNYFNAVGLSYVDVAIALAMFERATAEGMGEELTMQETMIFDHPQVAEWARF